MSLENCQPATIAAWAGEERPVGMGATQVPIVHSAPFSFPDMDTWLEVAQGRAPGHMYSRISNPTVAVLEEKVRALEGAEAATAFATGMGAISSALFSLLKPGDRVVSTMDTYGGTSKMFLEWLPRGQITVDLVDTDDAEALERAIAKGCQLAYLETPTNPTLKVIDLARMIAAAKRAGAISIVDNTFATPINQLPLALGADLVVHSATKFLGGHDDAMGGVLAGRQDLVRAVATYRDITGSSLNPFAAYLILRGLKTLSLRVRQQNSTALAMSRFLSGHAAIESVFYPGLREHPRHDVAARQMTGYGGVLSFALKGGFEATKRFIDGLKLAARAPSLGSVNTLVGTPGTTSHIECTAEERARLGIPESLVRYSCGVEDFEDLKRDVEQALRR